MRIQVSMSAGEALDYLLILSIKRDRVRDRFKKLDAGERYQELYAQMTPIWNEWWGRDPFCTYWDALLALNQELWDLEDKIREPDLSTYDTIITSKLIRKLNDDRADVKNAVSRLLGDEVGEIKQH